MTGDSFAFIFLGGKMTRSIKVVPAVLTDDPKSLEAMLKQSAAFTDYVQIDIMDGKFVPSRSITWYQIKNIPAGLGWEAHLMVEQPEKHLEHFKKAGAQKVIFHFEATPHPQQVISAGRKLGIQIGLAVNPETPVTKIIPFTGELDGVLFLSVHPGYYGAKFLPEVLYKVTELRQACPEMEIGIDGGIKENNIVQVSKSGVNVIFVGSAVFLQTDPGASYRKLQSIVI
jgi:ribulose-phosphate 3-epimerase